MKARPGSFQHWRSALARLHKEWVPGYRDGTSSALASSEAHAKAHAFRKAAIAALAKTEPASAESVEKA